MATLLLGEVEEKIRRLKLEGWLSVRSNERTLTLLVSEDALIEESKLDGCYVIKTDLKPDVASAQLVHDPEDLCQTQELPFHSVLQPTDGAPCKIAQPAV